MHFSTTLEKAVVFGVLLFVNFTKVVGDDCGSIVVDTNRKYQTIEGFGASDAWNADFVGRYFSDVEKARAARWLFSDQFNSSGNPEGIGLSKWRFYLGAGSAEQEAESLISNPTRRGSSFLNPNGSNWNWDRAAGQRWFLQKAVEYGVENFLAFSISPHVSQTKNGLARSTDAGLVSNMDPDNAQSYADYLTKILCHFRDQYGIDFRYISPVNETQYQWNTDKQEGSSFTNGEIANIARALDRSLELAGLDTKILLPESADWEYLYQVKDSPLHSDQIAEFFSPDSANYIGGLQRVANAVAGHSYWLNRTLEETVAVREKVAARAEEYGVSLHQSEYSFIEKNLLQFDPPESHWEIALYIARIIQSDLRFANVVSWSFWTAFEQDIWNTQNRYHLIRMDARDSSDLGKGGTLAPEKTLWVLGQFSFFIRPGYQRISLSGADDLDGLLASAFLSPDGETVVIVAVNSSADSIHRRINIEGCAVNWSKSFITDSLRDLTEITGVDESNMDFPPHSVVTLIGQIEPNY
jgi:O-glycosyl hydrolase